MPLESGTAGNTAQIVRNSRLYVMIVHELNVNMNHPVTLEAPSHSCQNGHFKSVS